MAGQIALVVCEGIEIPLGFVPGAVCQGSFVGGKFVPDSVKTEKNQSGQKKQQAQIPYHQPFPRLAHDEVFGGYHEKKIKKMPVKPGESGWMGFSA
jgi:hypothetical protein